MWTAASDELLHSQMLPTWNPNKISVITPSHSWKLLSIDTCRNCTAATIPITVNTNVANILNPCR